MLRVLAPCVDCGSSYFFWRTTKRRVFRCPECWAEYDRVRGRRYAATHREQQRAYQRRRWRERHAR